MSVPVVDAPVTVRVEPSIARAKDVDTARLAVVVDNAAANRPATVRLAGTDPELAVAFHFDPAEITVGPGESGPRASGDHVGPARTGSRAHPVADRERDRGPPARRRHRHAGAVDVAGGRGPDGGADGDPVPGAAPRRRQHRGAGDRSATRPAGSGRPYDSTPPTPSGWSTSAGAPRRCGCRPAVRPTSTSDVSCPAIEPGTEVSREVALVASDGKRTARTPVTLRQSASTSPMTTLAVRLDPSVVRLTNRRRGSSAVIVDNGQGRAPIRLWLRGDDPENVLAFTFTPAQLDIPAGQSVTSRMSFSGPRAPGGREITRSFTVAATDGRSAATNTGSIIQSASDRRPVGPGAADDRRRRGDPAGRDAAVRRPSGPAAATGR